MWKWCIFSDLQTPAAEREVGVLRVLFFFVFLNALCSPGTEKMLFNDLTTF